VDIKTPNLPLINVIVKAKCKRIDGSIEEHFIKRIHSKETSKGWHWSNPEIKTYFTLEVLSFEYL
jgi:hypothetical protein